MRITKVLGNVKAGCDVEIGAKTLIVGPNGSGKSSVVNTIELALTGRAGDIAGRVDVAREVDVMSLAQPGLLQAVTAQVTFDDGSTAGYQTEGSTAKAKKAVVQRPGFIHEDVLPIRSLREALLGSPATARKYLLSKVSDGVTLEAAKAMVDPEAHELFDAVVRKDAKPADALIAALEKAGSMSREANASVKALKQAAAFVTGGAAAPPTNEQIAALQATARQLQDEYVAAVAGAARASNLPHLREEVAKAEEAAVAAVAAYNKTKEDLAALGEPPAGPGADFDTILKAARLSADAGECVVCGSAEVGHLHGDIGAAEEQFKVHLASKAAFDAIKRAEAAAKREAERAVSAYERAEEELGRAEKLAAAPAEASKSPDEIRALYEAAQLEAEEAKAKRSAWDTAYRAQAKALSAEKEAAEWAVLKTGLTVAVEKLVDGALKGFIEKVQASLPDTDTFDMRLRDGDREVVQFGLVRSGQLHTALSGAEWARVMAAMASACVPEGAYACIIPEERAFDPVTLASVMKALVGNPHQIIITSPVAPKSVPKGWVVVKRGDA